MDEQKQREEELGDNLGDIFKEDFYENELFEEPKLKSLHKVKKNSMIAGVCTGLAKYFEIEPIIVRVLFVVSIFIGGWGIVAYLLAAMLIPSEILIEESDKEVYVNNYPKTIAGTFFVFISLFFIADNFGALNNLFFFGVSKYFIVPLILVSSGLFILLKTNELKPLKSGTRETKLLRSKNDRRYWVSVEVSLII